MSRPVWVVVLSTEKRMGKPADRDIKYVRAATQAGAVKCAKFHSTLPARCFANAHIASPQELGCVPTQGLAE
jgi:hypothetical protein